MSKQSDLSFGDYGLLMQIAGGDDSIIIPDDHLLSKSKYVEVIRQGNTFKTLATPRGIKELTKERRPFKFKSSKLDASECPRCGEDPISITTGEMK